MCVCACVCVSVSISFIYVCAPYVYLVPAEVKRGVRPLELELLKDLSHIVRRVNRTQNLCKCNQCIRPMNHHLSSTGAWDFAMTFLHFEPSLQPPYTYSNHGLTRHIVCACVCMCVHVCVWVCACVVALSYTASSW